MLYGAPNSTDKVGRRFVQIRCRTERPELSRGEPPPPAGRVSVMMGRMVPPLRRPLLPFCFGCWLVFPLLWR